MFRRMMKAKRRPLDNGAYEPWLDWQKRSLRAAADVIRRLKCFVTNSLLDAREHWANHISRFGLGGRPQHLLKQIMLWRNLNLWLIQQNYNGIQGATRLVHRPKLGKVLKYELSSRRNWMEPE